MTDSTHPPVTRYLIDKDIILNYNEERPRHGRCCNIEVVDAWEHDQTIKALEAQVEGFNKRCYEMDLEIHALQAKLAEVDRVLCEPPTESAAAIITAPLRKRLKQAEAALTEARGVLEEFIEEARHSERCGRGNTNIRDELGCTCGLWDICDRARAWLEQTKGGDPK